MPRSTEPQPYSVGTPACAPRIRGMFESALLALAQKLVVDDPIAGARDRFVARVAERLRASHPELSQREMARCLVLARRACLRETLEGD